MSSILLGTEYRSNRLDGVRSALSVILYPVQLLANMPAELLDNAVLYGTLYRQNQALRQSLLIDSAKLQKYEALESENIRLHSLLDNSFKLGEQVLVAQLLSVTLAPYEHLVVINKGSRFGVHTKQAVLDLGGVAGQVIYALPFNAQVMLITDPNHAIPVQINRNGLRTIAVGSGNTSRLNLPFLPNNADVVVGDLLVTSGLGGVFPSGYPVAVVQEFTAQTGKSFATVYATPKAKLDQSRELLIVWNNTTPIKLIPPASTDSQAK